jgi:tRNA (guanine-N7-)-methyltransferase
MAIANPYSTKLIDYPDLIIDALKPDRWQDSSIKIKEKIGVFKNYVIELGSGSGEHLLARAVLEPATLFIGVEIRFKRIYKTAEKSTQIKLTNLLLLRIFAEDILQVLPEKSASIVYINFPDPWAKRRWLKHRLVSKDYLKVLHKLLKKDGTFSFKTDHPDYFQDVKSILLELGTDWITTKASSDLYNSEYLKGNIPTEFERLFISKGMPINFLEAHPVGDL